MARDPGCDRLQQTRGKHCDRAVEDGTLGHRAQAQEGEHVQNVSKHPADGLVVRRRQTGDRRADEQHDRPHPGVQQSADEHDTAEEQGLGHHQPGRVPGWTVAVLQSDVEARDRGKSSDVRGRRE